MHMDKLPAELIFHIASFLQPLEIVRLQLVSKRLLRISRDNRLWKSLCFDDSKSEALRKRRELLFGGPPAEARVLALQWTASSLTQTHGETDNNPSSSISTGTNLNQEVASRDSAQGKARAICCWDPSYLSEKIDWYQEYIHRHGPISLSWLQQPFRNHGGTRERIEMRGMAYLESTTDEAAARDTAIVAPLDDGSVCLWDIWGKSHGSGSRKGRIVARSEAGLLSAKGPRSRKCRTPPSIRAEMTNSGAVECVSVDNIRRKAYFAVQSGLNEVDLETLQLISHRRFPHPISTISEAKFPVPLTVGTNASLHLYDPREGGLDHSFGGVETGRCEISTTPLGLRHGPDSRRNMALSNIDLGYAPLFQPGPVTILHLPGPNGQSASNGDIYVAGRFPSILHYDRRYWPKLHRTVHSGARLSGLTWIPYPSKSLGTTPTVQNLPIANNGAKSEPLLGSTLVACGEYNGKGSLELYGLPSTAGSSSDRPVSATGNPKVPNFKNRHTASRSKLLSVANHGTRIVFSDGDGMLKWIERDGSINVRRWSINSATGSREEPRGLFPAAGGSALERGSADVARKILPVHNGRYLQQTNQDDLMIWSGERIGHLSFSTSSPLSAEDGGEEEPSSAAEARKSRDEEIYSQTMRKALERQADEARFVRGFGMG
ncbi:MAG: hypothetical protein M1837_001526 [Sclerophora amabilis]|nr:MAG: hypothetical protein M1837_001526 [Sclerophora amabilis]